MGGYDVNYIGAGVTMNAQRNLNALESQVIHDAQWNGQYNGQYNAKVAASQASDAAQPAGASDVADAQADATSEAPATNAPVANTDAPAQAAKSSDTHVGGASDVINNIADGAKTNQTPAVTPADKPATEAPKTDAPAPATSTDKGNDTNIGNASDIIKGVDDGANTPATQPATGAPAEAQKPVSETPKTDAPATNAPTSAAPSSVASSSAASSTSTPVEVQSPASDAPMSHEVPANPVDGSTFIEVDPDSGRSFGTLTYHTSFSGISVNDLTHGEYQGLWLDHSGNAVNPYKAYAIYYTKQDMDNLVTRYNDAQTPINGTELERPDQLVGGASSVINSIG